MPLETIGWTSVVHPLRLGFEMTVSDSSTLSALMAAYDNAVVFEESIPTTMRLAKLFPMMRWANGGLVLLGVKADGSVTGVPRDQLDRIYNRFEQLCFDLTETRIEMGTLHVSGRCVVFLVFNTVPRHLDPLSRYAEAIDRREAV